MIDGRNGIEYLLTPNSEIIMIEKNKKPRSLGVLDRHASTLAIRRKKPSHWHRSKMGWGFNEFVLRNCREFGFCLIRLERAYHPVFLSVDGYVPVTTLLKRVKLDSGSSSQGGFEPQVYIERRDVVSLSRAKNEVRDFWTKGISADSIIPVPPSSQGRLF